MVDYILFIHSSVDWDLEYFYFYSIMNNVVMNIGMQVFIWTCFIFPKYIIYLGVELLSNVPLFNWETARLFSQVAAMYHFEILPRI